MDCSRELPLIMAGLQARAECKSCVCCNATYSPSTRDCSGYNRWGSVQKDHAHTAACVGDFRGFEEIVTYVTNCLVESSELRKGRIEFWARKTIV